MPDKTWPVDVTRKVRLLITAPTEGQARERALDRVWEWTPEEADGGDQGSVTVRVAGDDRD